MTASPLLNFQPSLIVMVKFCESVLSTFSASMSSAAPVLALYRLSPRKIMSRTLPPWTSLVLAGSSGFCGSPHEELTTPVPSPPPLSLSPPPQAVAARATAAAHAAHLACVAPRMECLLKSALCRRRRSNALGSGALCL